MMKPPGFPTARQPSTGPRNLINQHLANQAFGQTQTPDLSQALVQRRMRQRQGMMPQMPRLRAEDEGMV